MTLTPDRSIAVDTELQYIQAYLTALAVEIEAAEPPTKKQGYLYQVAVTATGWLAQLRHTLQSDQAQESCDEEAQHQVSDAVKSNKTAA